jgi:hypothetical protein
MSLTHNAERGEVPLTVGGVDLVIAAEMRGLASLSARLGLLGFSELYSRLASAEINATMAAVECLAVMGDAEKAVADMGLSDLPRCTEAFMMAFKHHADKASGNEKAAKKETTKSLGGDGKDSQP